MLPFFTLRMSSAKILTCKEAKMLKFTVVFLLIVVCLGELFDENENFDEFEGFDEDKEIDEDEEFGENEDEVDEDEAVASQVSYLDRAREALLKFAADLRKGNVTNAFLKVIDDFEKQIANFQASLGRRKIKCKLVEKVKMFIKEASKDRRANTQVLRGFAAQGLFLSQVRATCLLAKRDLLLSGALAFLESIREDIGDTAFEEFLSVSGLVTLIFAIDDTGSMGEDIKSAIAIATQIVRARRDYDVDYILSPFNDPTTGPITVKNESQGEEFLQILSRLKATGGGDCPELAFKGMIDALESGPQPGSSMYVFTDASPKDATKDNIDEVLNLANDLDIRINFFSKGDCSKPADVAVYDRIASDTGGLVYPLKSSLEIKELGRLVLTSLRGSASIGSGGSGSTSGRRRRALSSEYSITVDDSIEKLLITVTTQNSGAVIFLLDPEKNTVTKGRTVLSRGVVYELTNPAPGVYKLVVPVTVGIHKYRVNLVSGTNIDFGHYYAFIPKRGRNRVPVPIEQPLQGITAVAFITVAGSEAVNSASLRMKVVGKTGTGHENKPLESIGTSGVRYIFKFKPLPGPFKLQLNGLTKKGNKFVRSSARDDQAVAVILRLSYTPSSNTLPRGKTTRLTVQIRRGDVGKRVEIYTVTLKDQRKYGKVPRPTAKVRRGRIGFARIAFAVPKDAPKGKTEKVEVLLTKEGNTSPTATLTFSLLIV